MVLYQGVKQINQEEYVIIQPYLMLSVYKIFKGLKMKFLKVTTFKGLKIKIYKTDPPMKWA